MLTFLDTITGFIAPHECLACGHEGALLCDICIQLLPQPVPRCYGCARTDNGWETCKSCRKHSSLERVVAATLYEGFAEAIVRKLKFERAYASHTTLAKVMAPFVSKGAVVVPIPTATSRVRERGYDQAMLVASAIARACSGSNVIALERLGQKRQTGSSRRERIKQLDGAFTVNISKLKDVERVVLIDDVVTTGATFEAAATSLRKAGARHIEALAFARAE